MQANFKLNQIIDLLPLHIYEEWTPHFELIDLKLGQTLYEPGQKVAHLHFPLTAIVSGVHILENGDTTQIAMTGNEGVVGIDLLIGAARTLNRAVVLKAGLALRLKLKLVMISFNQEPLVQQLVLKFTQTSFTQIAQGSVCNRHHTLDHQLCCMILRILDRQDDSNILLTHESIATLLGVRREGVTQAAKRLMNASIINYSRGHIKVLDRPALEGRACECYSVTHHEEHRLLTTA